MYPIQFNSLSVSYFYPFSELWLWTGEKSPRNFRSVVRDIYFKKVGESRGFSGSGLHRTLVEKAKLEKRVELLVWTAGMSRIFLLKKR